MPKFAFSLLKYLLAIACLAHTAAFAADNVLVSGDGVSVDNTDLSAEAQRMPLEARKRILIKPESVAQLASNLYIRRALAAEAERAGFANDSVIAATVKLARERVLSDAWMAQIDAKNTPSDDALNAYALTRYRSSIQQYETPAEISARHILIKSSIADARTKAEKLLTELKTGADFDALAKANSEDTGSAPKGGDLGFFPRGRMVAPFDEAAWQLAKPGDLSGIVETQFGFHIIRLDAKREATVKPFEEVRDQLRKDTLSSLLNDARGRESQRILSGAKFEQPAIEAFAASQR
ncbi:MAG: peptidyl-prolyl cis-trans isomerase [Pseudomonadota bacterium]|nr:peptidyl-prolyl cis-trans isomerase [Pseudomonadota bacterium]